MDMEGSLFRFRLKDLSQGSSWPEYILGDIYPSHHAEGLKRDPCG